MTRVTGGVVVVVVVLGDSGGRQSRSIITAFLYLAQQVGPSAGIERCRQVTCLTVVSIRYVRNWWSAVPPCRHVHRTLGQITDQSNCHSFSRSFTRSVGRSLVRSRFIIRPTRRRCRRTAERTDGRPRANRRHSCWRHTGTRPDARGTTNGSTFARLDLSTTVRKEACTATISNQRPSVDAAGSLDQSIGTTRVSTADSSTNQ